MRAPREKPENGALSTRRRAPRDLPRASSRQRWARAPPLRRASCVPTWLEASTASAFCAPAAPSAAQAAHRSLPQATRRLSLLQCPALVRHRRAPHGQRVTRRALRHWVLSVPFEAGSLLAKRADMVRDVDGGVAKRWSCECGARAPRAHPRRSPADSSACSSTRSTSRSRAQAIGARLVASWRSRSGQRGNSEDAGGRGPSSPSLGPTSCLALRPWPAFRTHRLRSRPR